ncbi:hypothetical protein Tco_1428026, partial [Tanacetum coccineum]
EYGGRGTCPLRCHAMAVMALEAVEEDHTVYDCDAVMVPSAPNHEIPKTTSTPSTGSIKNGISINTVTGYVLMKPVIRKVWADDIPKYAAADKDHNCGVGVSSGGTVSFGSGKERCSSLSTIMRNWGGEHLCPGTNFSGQQKRRPSFRRGVLVSGFDEGVMENGLGEYGNLEHHRGRGMLLVQYVPPVESYSTKRGFPPEKSSRGGFVPSNDGSTILGDLGLLWWYEDKEGGVPVFWKVYVRSLVVVRGYVIRKGGDVAVSWAVLRSAAELVAEMSCVRRSVSGGWASSLVVSRRGGMAAGELRMKAPNDGTNYKDLREEE